MLYSLMNRIFALILFLLFTGNFSNHAEILKRKRSTKILVAGDVMFNWGLREITEKEGASAPVEGVSELFEEADFRMVNLETPVANNNDEIDLNKSYVFNAKPEDLNVLKKINIDLVFLGNNHSMDYGKKGMEDTLENLSKAGIKNAGLGKNLSEAFEMKFFTVRNSKFGIVSVSNIGEGRLFSTDSRPGIAPLNLKRLKQIAAANKDKTVQNMLSIHWGVEYDHEPTKQQIAQGHELIDGGYKVIIGHHPHIPQGIEKYKNGVIIYSLGNFLFGSKNQFLNHNIAVMIHFLDGEIQYCEIIPIFGKFQTADHKIKTLDYKEAQEYLYEYSVLCDKLGTKLEVVNGRGYIFFRNSK